MMGCTLYLFRMASGPIEPMEPVELCLDDVLPSEGLTEWLEENCPGCHLSPLGTMASQLAKGLQVEEKILRLGVKSVLTDIDSKVCQVCDDWLTDRDLSLDQYLEQVCLVGADCDDLFL